MYTDDGVLEEINIFDTINKTYRVIKFGPGKDTLSDEVLKN